LNAAASYDPNGDVIVGYSWVLELVPAGSSAMLDGSDTVSPTLLPDVVGDYVVSLTVSDGLTTSIADEVFIRVIENLPPLAIINATPLSGFAPLTVQFDASNSSDPENSPLSYSWDFGTGGDSSDLVAPAFTYTLPGTYNVVLSVRDDFGNESEAVVEIVVSASNEPPVVAPYTTTPAQGPAPLTVSFVANASDPDGDVLSYFWDFGDGDNSTEANPQHVFYYPGSYTVILQVSDGEFTTTAQLFVAVQSSLSIDEIEAELDWGKRHHGSKLKLEIELGDAVYPQTDDKVRVAFGELMLLEVLFADFEKVKPGVYIYKSRRVYAKFDVNDGSIKISKRLKSSAVETGQPVPVMVSIGEAMATEQVTLSVEKYHHGDRRNHRKHAKFCKRKSRNEHYERRD
jgi:PKD repeat protein